MASTIVQDNDRKIPIIPSPNDPRDHLVASVYPRNIQSQPSTLDLRPLLLPIRDQSTTSQCGAFSAACMREYHEKKDINFNEYMSTEWIYHHRSNKNTDGMFARDLMNILKNNGTIRESNWKFNTPEPDVQHLESFIPEGKNYNIASYARCLNIEETKKALFLSGPCLVTFPVYNLNKTRFWVPDFEGQKNSGGHAMVFVGYTTAGFIIRNSWGTRWGDNGYTIMPYSDFKHVWEIYVTYDNKSNKKYIDNVFPDPKNPVPQPSTPGKKKSKCKCIIM